MWKVRIIALLIVVLGAGLGYSTYSSEKGGNYLPKFSLGLDLSGGTHLVYRADVSALSEEDIEPSMDALRDVIERRVNLFGVSEPVVQVEKGNAISGNGGEQRLIVELPGITEVAAAVKLIGETPLLQFKVERPDGETQKIIEAIQKGEQVDKDPYLDTSLTGRFLKKASLQFAGAQNAQGRFSNDPIISLEFNEEGTKLFAEMTKASIGKTIAIYLDGAPISAPVVNEEIPNGQAQISGGFTPQTAKELVGRLNSGALPVPIELISTESTGAALGSETTKAGVRAGVFAFLFMALFLIVWYRVPGLIAVAALALYTVINLVLFKIIPVTLTAAGIAAFILSIGMAVDANILIFERMKEELKKGRTLPDAIHEGFARAWTSIRDSNLSSIITAVILYTFASTNIIKGFALVFALGVITSMFSAITVSRTLLRALGVSKTNKVTRFLFGSGFVPSSKDSSGPVVSNL